MAEIDLQRVAHNFVDSAFAERGCSAKRWLEPLSKDDLRAVTELAKAEAQRRNSASVDKDVMHLPNVFIDRHGSLGGHLELTVGVFDPRQKQRDTNILTFDNFPRPIHGDGYCVDLKVGK